METAYDFFLDHFALCMALLAPIAASGFFAISAGCDRPTTRQGWWTLFRICAVAGVVFALALSAPLLHLTGAYAVSIANTLPSQHPGQVAYRQARETHNPAVLLEFENRYRDPISTENLLALDLAMRSRGDDPAFAEARAELASGYVSKARFEELGRALLHLRRS